MCRVCYARTTMSTLNGDSHIIRILIQFYFRIFHPVAVAESYYKQIRWIGVVCRRCRRCRRRRSRIMTMFISVRSIQASNNGLCLRFYRKKEEANDDDLVEQQSRLVFQHNTSVQVNFIYLFCFQSHTRGRRDHSFNRNFFFSLFFSLYFLIL